MFAIPIALAAALTAALTAAPSLPPGTVVAGVSTHDGVRTDVTAFLPDGTSRVLVTEAHAAGFVPKGSLDRSDARAARVALAVQHDGADGATVVVHDLSRAQRMTVGERAIASQAPRISGSGVTWVRAAETPARSSFDVVTARIDGGSLSEEVLASIDGAWLAPIGDERFVNITTAGLHRVVALRGASLDVERALGKGPMRLPAHTLASGVVVERALPNGRARLERVSATGTQVLREGIAGMDPLVVHGAPDVVVAGAGTKRAAVVVLDGKSSERVLELGRAGVATPVTAAMVQGALVVVARLDRGRALPPEVWVVDSRGARAIAPGGAIEIYGVIGGAR